MERKVLLDTNLIIAAFDNNDSKAINQIKKLLNDENVALAISPLIRYEVLRGVQYSCKMKNIKASFINNRIFSIFFF